MKRYHLIDMCICVCLGIVFGRSGSARVESKQTNKQAKIQQVFMRFGHLLLFNVCQ